MKYPDYKREGEGYQEWFDSFYQGSWKNDEQNIGMYCLFGGGGSGAQCPGH